PKDDERHVLLIEKWRDQAALDAHSKGPMPGNTYKDWIVGRKVARGAPVPEGTSTWIVGQGVGGPAAG
ncbi:MAG TPA: antibiotic biosynthesis monooxygenase, partial [Stellaceae bacterium]|nr:antibiotic biosynthesis monooxygenase [Stellaceae bacterium]